MASALTFWAACWDPGGKLRKVAGLGDRARSQHQEYPRLTHVLMSNPHARNIAIRPRERDGGIASFGEP